MSVSHRSIRFLWILVSCGPNELSVVKRCVCYSRCPWARFLVSSGMRIDRMGMIRIIRIRNKKKTIVPKMD